MRFAVLTDVHGDAERLHTVLTQIRGHAVDRVLSLGDVFECKVSKSRIASFRYRTIADVFDANPAFADLLEDTLLVRGNQEERIVSLVPDRDLPTWARPILDAPLEHRTGLAIYCHGHRRGWSEVRPGVWSPVDPPLDRRILVHGHHHRSAVHRFPEQGTDSGAAEPLPVRFGVPIPLPPGARYLVNVGSVTAAPSGRGPTPAWALIDEAAASVTFHHRDDSDR